MEVLPDGRKTVQKELIIYLRNESDIIRLVLNYNNPEVYSHICNIFILAPALAENFCLKKLLDFRSNNALELEINLSLVKAQVEQNIPDIETRKTISYIFTKLLLCFERTPEHYSIEDLIGMHHVLEYQTNLEAGVITEDGLAAPEDVAFVVDQATGNGEMVLHLINGNDSAKAQQLKQYMGIKERKTA